MIVTGSVVVDPMLSVTVTSTVTGEGFAVVGVPVIRPVALIERPWRRWPARRKSVSAGPGAARGR